MKNLKLPACHIQFFTTLVDDLEQGKEISLDWFFSLKNDLGRAIKGKIWGDAICLDVSQDDLLKVDAWLENFDYDCGLAYDNNDNAEFTHSLPATSFQEMRTFLFELAQK